MRIPLAVAYQSRPSAVIGEPVTFGVPLPRGLASPQTRWVVEAAGHTEPVEVRALDHWPDGSVRWMLVDARVRDWLGDAPELRSVADRSEGGPEPLRAGQVHCEESAGELVVDTGAARFVFRSGGAFPFERIVCEEADVVDSASTERGVIGTGESGVRSTARVQEIQIEHRGRLRVSVKLVGTLTLGARAVWLEARVDLFAGLTAARVRLTVRNRERARHPGNYWDLGDPGSVLIRDLSLVLPLPAGGAASPVHLSPEADEPWNTVTGPLEVYQDSSGGEAWQSTNHVDRHRKVPVSFRGYRVVSGSAPEGRGNRATPAVFLEHAGGGVGVAVPAFWQNFPKAIEASGRLLTLRLFPGQYAGLHELQGGEQKTHECVLVFGRDRTSRSALDWCRLSTMVTPQTDWYESSGAVDLLAPLDAGHASLVAQAVDGDASFEHKREVIDEYGWRHFGEIYGDHEAIGHTGSSPLVSHYNNQYDPVLGFGLQFLRTGDRRWWSAMDELATHVIDIDIYHTVEDKAAYNGGLFWHTYHYGDADTATHRTYPARNTGTIAGGGPSADHNYPAGLVLHYYLTGDEASRDAAIGLARYVLNLDDGRLSPFRWLSHADTGRATFTPPDYFGPSRSSGNSLGALVDGHRLTRDPRFLAKADQLVVRVIHPDDDQHALRLDEPEIRWFYLMFMQSLGKYLRHKAELGEVDRYYAHGRASLLAYARWMSMHEYPYLAQPAKLEYPTETWAAQDIRKVDVFCSAALVSTSQERDALLERAAFFHRNSIETLMSMPTRHLARPVIVLLTSGLALSWVTRHRDSALPVPAANLLPFPRTTFVPQRKIAERRALVIGVALAAVSGAALVIAVLRWL